MKEAILVEGEDYYGLPTFDLNGQIWVIGEDWQLNEIASKYIKETLWCFNSQFLRDFFELYCNIKMPIKALEALADEEYNDSLLELLNGNLEKFIEHAIETDGRGNFLSSYNDEESLTKDVPGLNPKFGEYCFRID